MKGLTVFAALLLSCAACTTSNSQDGIAGPIAYLANGEVHASCENGDVLVTNARFVENFAIRGTTLALVSRMEDGTSSLFVVDMNSRQVLSSKRAVGGVTVRDTCGSLMIEFPQSHGDISPSVAMDVGTGQTFESSFRNVGLACSRDRSLIAFLALDEKSKVALVVRDALAQNSATIAQHADVVSVAPLGQFVGYRDGDKICRWNRHDQSTECVDSNAVGPWIQAMDDGHIWFSAAGSENCIYHLPNMKPKVDFCLDLYSWRAKEASVLLRNKTEMLQPLKAEAAKLLCKRGFNPVLITAESSKK